MKEKIENLLNKEILSIDYFTSGWGGKLYKALSKDKTYIIKESSFASIEAKMLNDLRDFVNTPNVHYVNNDILIIDYIPNSAPLDEEKLALNLVKLHSNSNSARMYGYYYDTPIANFLQKNEQTQYNFGLFFGEFRLKTMAKVVYDLGYIDKNILNKIETLSNNLYKILDLQSIKPSLIHGDLWSGNILSSGNNIYFIDPAIYFADREVELAFILMFNSFGDKFFKIYNHYLPLSKDFYDKKVPIYQLYPYLVHCALYGKTYLNGIIKNLELLRRFYV